MDLPLSAVSFSCRLPVLRETAGGDYVSYRGGFVTFPSATFEEDSKGVINSEYLERDFVTEATPPLHGTPHAGPPFYDLAMKRWVPASAAQASPDGAFYAYSAANSSHPGALYVIHIVNVANGKDRTFMVPTTDQAFGDAVGAYITEFDGASVYFSSFQSIGPSQGVWRLDIATGSVTELSKVSGVAMIRGGYAWLARIDPRDPQGPETRRSGLRSNSVVRLNLSTRQNTVWYYAPGQQVFLRGFDVGGRLIVGASPGPDFARTAIRLMSDPEGPGTVIYDGTGGLWFSSPQADRAGQIWFGNDRGIYLWTPSSGLRKVFAFSSTFPGETMIPAGFCL